jgi:sugar/nucleoside kinase (ribokinase family)
LSFAAGIGVTNCDLLFAGVPRLPREGEEVGSRSFLMQLGGGVPGTMIWLARLGVASRLCTYLGRDFLSEFAKREMDKAGVDYVNLYDGDGRPIVVTAVAITERDRTFLSSKAELSITDGMIVAAERRLGGASVARMGNNPRLFELFKKLKEGGAKLVLDMGWSEDMSVRKDARYLELADYYLPNRAEALRITGADSVSGAADALGGLFRDVVIKLDADGCFFRTGGGDYIAHPLPRVKAVDSTGAGDAFCAGFMYGIYHGKTIFDCVRYGCVAGGTCVQGIGCLASSIDEAGLLSLAEEIEIAPLGGRRI